MSTTGLDLKPEFTQSLHTKVSAELVHLLYRHALPTTFASFAVAAFFVYTLHSDLSHQVLLQWYSFMLATGLIRLVSIKIYLRNQPAPEQINFWRNLFILLVALSAIGWSFASTFFVPSSDIYEVFVACTIAGVTGSAVTSFSASRLACIAFIAPILLSFTAWCLWQDQWNCNVLSVLSLLYLILLIFSSLRAHRVIREALELKFENSGLVDHLLIAQEELKRTNTALQAEITERQQIEILLRESEEQHRLVMDALPVLIAYLDPQLHYRFVNKAYEEWLGKSRDKITGKHIKEVLGDTVASIFSEYCGHLTTEEQVTYETVMDFANHKDRYVSVTLIPHIKNGIKQGLFSLVSDVTPRINYLATHDALTGLPNRSFFAERCQHGLKRAQRNNSQVALLFLDLDHFKNVNDTLGHDVGDQLLIKVSERLQGCLRESDTLARLGGDEFMIMLEDVQGQDSVAAVTNKLCHVFSFPFKINNHDIFITTSIGISFYPDDSQVMQVLFKNADMAMYHAKEKGRNAFQFYTQEMNDIVAKKSQLANGLRSALEKNEFSLHYQPLFDIQANQLSGLEALLRWNHPRLGLVSPGEFIPVAEETGLIIPIGEWVLQAACMQNGNWHKTGLIQRRISINISARQFKEKNLLDMIRSALQKAELKAEYIALEITESLIMHDLAHSEKVIKSLQELGVAIVMDDFGTGYSSLNYLKRFPIDVLKIDRSFIADIISNTDDAAIVSAIIAMAQSLNMKVVAEGVETAEQYAFLKERGCHEIQGYLISPPLAVNEMSNFLQQSHAITEALRTVKKDTLPITY
ncbi:MAG: hypothetical protein A3E84_01290 [Gammaproteobacteria bacterium RIFCSPHIGHO2_12_FULL_42_13]|nr:MAG: hypothetical protein A3E84_01290 [Gammaproteobacteria bacterium RIFCSPHIGHO2_12_FULL_42_13]